MLIIGHSQIRTRGRSRTKSLFVTSRAIGTKLFQVDGDLGLLPLHAFFLTVTMPSAGLAGDTVISIVIASEKRGFLLR